MKTFGKDTIEFVIFKEYWSIFKKYSDIKNDDAYWNEVTEDTSAFSNKYKGTEYEKFALDLSLALVEMLDKKSKKLTPENEDGECVNEEYK